MWPRRRLVWMALAVIAGSWASPAVAAPISAPDPGTVVVADHLGGTFSVCGRILAYAPPSAGTSGSVTVAGTVALADHTFPIADSVAPDATIATLAAGGSWSCLQMVGDGMGVITSLAASSSTTCGAIGESAGQLGQTLEFTTLVLDGDAAGYLATDAPLALLLDALAAVNSWGRACLNFALETDGTLAGITLDYDGGASDPDLTAPIACGTVGGVAVPYRDPASQPYPAAGTVSVGGFELDADLLDPAFHSVLAFQLDSGLEPCLLVRVVDSVVVEGAVLTGSFATPCGPLEVRGGLVFVDGVVVSQALTTVNFAEPSEAELATPACADARSQEGAAIGTLTVCGTITGLGASMFGVDGITFHLDASLSADPTLVGTSGAFRLDGPNPLLPAADPAVLASTTAEGCAANLPDTSARTASPVTDVGIPLGLILVLASLAAIGGGADRRKGACAR